MAQQSAPPQPSPRPHPATGVPGAAPRNEAVAAGLRTALIRRGPWGTVRQHDPDADRISTLRGDSPAELPEKIAKLNAAGR